MRKLILAALALASWTCQASITFYLDADLLKSSDGSPMPTNGLVLLVASTTDSTFQGPTAGSFVTGDDIVLAKFDLHSSGTPGVLIDLTNNLRLAGNWSVNDPLALYWYPTLTIASSSPTGGAPYGMYTTATPHDDSVPWLTPSDGSTVNLRFITTDSDPGNHSPGTELASTGLANLVVPGVPTPPQLAISLLGGGNINVHLIGTANGNYALQYVNALLNVGTPWQTLSTNKADANGFIDFPDAPGTGPRYYRGQALP
jgi:hypothetical protein